MKKKIKVALGISLLAFSIVSLIACVQIIIETPKDFPTIEDKAFFIGFMVGLPFFISYLLLRNNLKGPILKEMFFGNERNKEQLEELLAKYFKPTTPNVPVGKTVSLSNDDEAKPLDIDECDKQSLNNAFFIKYKDYNGRISQRRITVIDIAPYGHDDFYLESFCHERKADRTFKLSRVDEIIDLETGEGIEDKMAYCYEKYYKMNENPVQQLLEEKESEALVLLFIARADGVLRKKELEVIVEYLTIDAQKNFDKEQLIKELKKIHCLIQEFKKHIRRIHIEKTEVEKAELLECINAVIIADKKADPLELAGLETIKKIFKMKPTMVAA